jgi:shikimate kinase/3-dehydroquinate synthase
VLKTALIAGGGLWDRVAAGGAVDDDVIVGCVRTKLRVVAADERDGGARQALNLGHTIGHAIETATGYRRYRHGEAVGLGVLAALRLSGADRLRDEVEAMLVAFAQPVRLDRSVALDAVMAALARDKKRTAEGVPFVLLSTRGEPRIGQVIDADRVEQAVTELYG